jgi:quinol monooxygenase YgiN
MAFVQTISFSTSRTDELMAMLHGMEDQEGSDSPEGFIRFRLLRDRDNEGRYVGLAEFESYELAMKNSQSEDTGKFAAQMAELCDEGPTFGNLDVAYEM